MGTSTIPYITSPSDSGNGTAFNPPDSLYKKYYVPQLFTRSGQFKSIDQFESEVLSWVLEAISEGEGYLRNQRGFEGADKAIDILTKIITDSNLDNVETISNVFLNETKRDLEENIAILSNVKSSWTYESNSNKDEQWKHQAKLLNNLNDDWMNNMHVNFTGNTKGMLQWAFTTGTGYIEQYFDPSLGNRGGEIVVKPRGWADCFPIGLSDSNNLQEAYAFIIRKEMDIRKVWKKWPTKAYRIVPDRVEPSLGRKISNLLFKSDSSVLFSDPKRKNETSPTVDVYYIYIDDFSINPTNKELDFGTSSWAYKVPAKNTKFPTGRYDVKGQPILKTAIIEEGDCNLYPNKRLIIATKTCILYDGPSYWWHGQYPIVKYCPDGWIWSYLGYSLVAQVASMNDSLVSMLRMMEDSLKLQLDPPGTVDEQLPPKLAEKSFRKPGLKLRGRVQMGDIFKPFARDYKPSGEHFNYLKLIIENIARQLGTPDLRSLQQAKQIPGGDSVEKYFAQAGAIVTDMSASMDVPLWQMADMNRYNFMQFYDAIRRVKILGIDGLTLEDLDYDPMSMIPDSLPNEPSTFDVTTGMQLNGVYASTRSQRAKTHVANFNTRIERTNAHEITSMQRKLMKIQLTKINPANGMISPETLAKEAGVKNWGTLKGDDELAKIRDYVMNVQLNMELEKMLKTAAVQAMIQKAMQGDSPEGQIAEGLKGLVGAAQGGGELSGGGGTAEIGAQNPGRPPEFQGAPTIQQKDDGTRGTITSSQPS